MSNNDHEHEDEHHEDGPPCHPGKPSTFHIIVNAQAHEVHGPRISYRELVNLAFPGDSGEIIYLIQYVAPHLPDGALLDGESVELENGMKFDVRATNRS